MKENRTGDVKKTIKDNIVFCAAGAIFVFLTLVTRTLTVYGNLKWSFGFFLKAVPASLIAGILLGFAINYALKLLLEKGLSAANETADTNRKSGGIFFISLAVLFLAFIPYFLAYFPGILAYDSYIQIGQIFSGEYNEHHPLFHTLMIKACLSAGQGLFKSLNAGIAVYVLMQMLLLSAVFSYGIFCLHKRGLRVLSYVVLALLAIFPFNGFMAVSVTKDIPFAIFFLLAVISLSEILFSSDTKINILNAVLLLCSGILCVLFRNNGKYAFAILFAVCLIVLIVKAVKKGSDEKKKEVKKFGFVTAGMAVSLIVSILLLLVISKSLNAVQGDRREMLSVPIQQLARTYVYHAGAGVKADDDNTMDEASKALINEFLLYDSAKLYRQDISDPVKRNTNTWVVVNKTSEFAKVYLGLFVKYPGDYINAFIAQNAGFIDVGDVSHAYVNDPEEVKGHGYVQTKWENSLFERGFYEDSKWPALRSLLDAFADNNAYLKVPVLKYIFMPGIYLWIYLFALIGVIKRKNVKAAPVISLIAGYYATMFFGPTVQLRYIYPVMITVPFLILICIGKTKKNG